MSRRHLKTCLAAEPVVVTGMGSVSAQASDPHRLWQLILEERSPADWVRDAAGPREKPTPACRAADFSLSPSARRLTHKSDRSVQLALAAAEQAYRDAGLNTIEPHPGRLGIVAGTSRGPVSKWQESFSRLTKRRPLPTLTVTTPIAGLSGVLAHAFDAKGPNYTVSATCSSAAHAIISGAQEILLGNLDFALVGGAEAPIQPAIVAQLEAAGILGTRDDPKKACRPFDRSRNGLLLGEGAGFLMLESLESAQSRGAAIHGHLSGWARGSDTSSRSRNDANGKALAEVIQAALDLASLTPETIDYINLHGTGTRSNDSVEANALNRLFRPLDEEQPPLPCSSTKPYTGHCLGATGAIEAVICLLALQHQYLPPTLNLESPEPDLCIDPIPRHGRPAKVLHVMSNALGFWGNQSSLIFTRCQG